MTENVLESGEEQIQARIKSVAAACGLTVKIEQGNHESPYYIYRFFESENLIQVIGDTKFAYYWIQGYEKGSKKSFA